MSARITGISDQVVVKDSGSIEVSLGWIQSANHSIDNATESKPGIGGGADFQYNLDSVVSVTGSIELVPVNLQVLELMGTKSAGTITLGDTLPEFTVQMNTSSGKYVEMTGVKFSPCKISLSKGEQPKISFDFIGKDASQVTGTLDYTEPTSDGLNYTDIKVKVGGTYVGSIDSGDISYDREIEGHRGIENQADRKISEIIEKLKNIGFSMTIEITDATAWNQVIGGSTLDSGTVRSDTTVTLEFGSVNEYIELTGARFSNLSEDKSADGEVRTVSCEGVALGASISYVV